MPVPGLVVWITGLPQTGKSTFARALQARLGERGAPSVVLDGDAVRGALVPAPGYAPEARDDFYATLANLAALVAAQGAIVIVPATAHAARFRARARERAEGRFLEVYVAADQATARARDEKGLYAAAAAGTMRHLPADAYEPPAAPDAVTNGGEDEAALDRVVSRVLSLLGPPA